MGHKLLAVKFVEAVVIPVVGLIGMNRLQGASVGAKDAIAFQVFTRVEDAIRTSVRAGRIDEIIVAKRRRFNQRGSTLVVDRVPAAIGEIDRISTYGVGAAAGIGRAERAHEPFGEVRDVELDVVHRPDRGNLARSCARNRTLTRDAFPGVKQNVGPVVRVHQSGHGAAAGARRGIVTHTLDPDHGIRVRIGAGRSGAHRGPDLSSDYPASPQEQGEPPRQCRWQEVD